MHYITMCSQIMSKILRSVQGRNLIRKSYISRKLSNTHYDTLQLPRTCTAKEIRESFIKLSKMCHPDCDQNNPENHERFVKLNEAYQILSRPEARKAYDLSLPHINPGVYHEDIYTTAPGEKVVWAQSFWENRDKSKDRKPEEDNYYGIKGIRRVHNGWIAFFLVIISLFGTAIQVMALRYGLTFSRDRLDEQDRKARKSLADIQAQKEHLSNDERIDLMKNQHSISKFPLSHSSTSEHSAR